MLPEPTDREITVYLVDDHEIVLHGLQEFIKRQDGFRVVGSATTASKALDELSTGTPDVVLIDVRLPDLDGISLCREIRSRHEETRCLMLSSFGSEEATMQAVIAGASGYLLKDADLADVVRAIREVAEGQKILDPSLAGRAIDHLRRGGRNELAQHLTSQEERILELVSEGLSNKEISGRLYLAEQTVKNYVSNLLTKLGMRRIEAAIYAKDRRDESEPPTHE